jgi:hypothetical protein
MNWKYTAIGTGATALATLMATTPARWPDAGATVPAAARSTAASPDVRQEAERLAARLREVTRFEEPSRNPFRFEAKPVSTLPVRAGGGAPEEAPPVGEEAPGQTPPALTLIGAVFDESGGSKPVMAILSTPSGVLLVQEGDRVGPELRVTNVDAEGVTVEPAGGASSFTIRFSQTR